MKTGLRYAAPAAATTSAAAKRRTLLAALAALGAASSGSAVLRRAVAASAAVTASAGVAVASSAAGVSSVAPVSAAQWVEVPSPPRNARIRFGVYYGSYVDGFQLAEIAYGFAHDGRRYEASTAGQAVGPISLIYPGVLTQRSAGLVTAAGLEPMRYAEKRGGRAEREVLFEREQGRVLFPKRRSAEWVPGVQDRLSLVWQLGLLARGWPERFAAGSEHHLPLASFSRIDAALIRSAGIERLRDGDAGFDTLHLVRPAEPGKHDETIELWLDRAAEMQLVRLRVTDRDARVLDHFRLPRSR